MRARGTERVSRLVPIVLDGPAGPIEALLQERGEHDPMLTAIVCHPHPLYGGTMHNKVVHRLASTLHGLDAAVLRFNFRGVGASAGAFDLGAGEREDARAGLAFLRERYPAARRWVAGFSFGAWVASRLAADEPDVERLVLVAPPVTTQTFEEMATCPVPKLVVQGTADDICPPEALARVLPAWAEPKRLMKVEGAGHFFDRHLAGLAQAVLEGIR
jgi:alpha/beta superfamily hydrolase